MKRRKSNFKKWLGLTTATLLIFAVAYTESIQITKQGIQVNYIDGTGYYIQVGTK